MVVEGDYRCVIVTILEPTLVPSSVSVNYDNCLSIIFEPIYTALEFLSLGSFTSSSF